jgi:hypothetical protein
MGISRPGRRVRFVVMSSWSGFRKWAPSNRPPRKRRRAFDAPGLSENVGAAVRDDAAPEPSAFRSAVNLPITLFALFLPSSVGCLGMSVPPRPAMPKRHQFALGTRTYASRAIVFIVAWYFSRAAVSRKSVR